MELLRVLPVMLLLGLVGHLSSSESAEFQGQTSDGARSFHAAMLPGLVARVNGVDITREIILERLEQYLTMMVHEPGMMVHEPASTSPAPAPALDESAPTEAPSADIRTPLTEEKERALLGHILRQLIVDELKAQEASRLGLTVSPELLAANVSQMEQQAGSRQALEESLKRGRTTVDRWYAQLRQALLLQALEAGRQAALPISDEAIRRNWQENREALSSLWQTDELPLVRERLRDLLRQARWPAAQADWEAELTQKAAIWIDPIIQERGIRWDTAQERQGQ